MKTPGQIVGDLTDKNIEIDYGFDTFFVAKMA